MKEKIKKLAQDLATAVTLLKEEKISEATDAIVKASEGIVELDTAAAEVEATVEKSKTELATANEAVQKSAEEIKKYANVSISTETMSNMLEEFKAIKDMMTGQTEVMKSVSTKEDISEISKRLDVIEKARDEKSLRDETRETMRKSAVPGLDLSPKS